MSRKVGAIHSQRSVAKPGETLDLVVGQAALFQHADCQLNPVGYKKPMQNAQRLAYEFPSVWVVEFVGEKLAEWVMNRSIVAQ